MITLKRLLAVMLSVSAMTTVSCSKKNNVNNMSETESLIQPETSAPPDEISDQTLYWLADYNLNPQENDSRSTALSLFEDVYNAKIEWIPCKAKDKLDVLSQRLNSGEPVDMLPYELGDFPVGVLNNLYQPLDPYYDILEIDTKLWNDMKNVIDIFEYDNSHYVVPYSISEPLIITYSRKLMESEGLEDPYQLYLDGKWNWDVMMNMMNTFVSQAPEGTKRYGINGWFGKALLQSTGCRVVDYDNGKFKNNITSDEIEKAGLLMQDITSDKLYNPIIAGYFPDNLSTLFFAMGDWSLGESNAKNQDSDLMVVPFPTMPDTDGNYITCNFNAIMLAKNSDKGKAVATYIKCERLAASSEIHKEAAKQAALTVTENASGNPVSFVTEEQYNAIQSFLDTEKVKPVFDFGHGLGKEMFYNGFYSFKSQGVMNNLEQALFEEKPEIESWDAMRDALSPIIDEKINGLN